MYWTGMNNAAEAENFVSNSSTLASTLAIRDLLLAVAVGTFWKRFDGQVLPPHTLPFSVHSVHADGSRGSGTHSY